MDRIRADEPPYEELVKEVYALFGACMYLGQVLEVGLSILLTTLETAKSASPTKGTFDRLLQKHQVYTFGRLIERISKHDVVSSELACTLKEALATRNRLAHHYFRENCFELQTVAGCRKLLGELHGLHEELATIDKEQERIRTRVLKKIDVSVETYLGNEREEMESLLKAAHHLSDYVET